MPIELKALIIDSSMSALEELEASMQPEITFEYLDVVNTVHKAIQYHMDMDFQLCLIGDSFPTAEVDSFFNDYKKLNKTSFCLFVQFRPHLPPNFDRNSLAIKGFDTIISLQGTKEDKDTLIKIIEPYFLEKEYQEIKGGLTDVVDYLMQEVDKIALEKKRGKEKDMSTIFSEHLKDSARKFENLHEDYIDKLAEVTNNSEPFTSTDIDVPDEIISKKLPHLSKEGYKGQSHRVFDKLLKLHGDKKDKKED
jgi:hypothetical protein